MSDGYPPPDWEPQQYCSLCDAEITSGEMCATCAKENREATMAHLFESDEAMRQRTKHDQMRGDLYDG